MGLVVEMFAADRLRRSMKGEYDEADEANDVDEEDLDEFAVETRVSLSPSGWLVDGTCKSAGSKQSAGNCDTPLPTDAPSPGPGTNDKFVPKAPVVWSQSIRFVYIGSSIVARASKQSSQTKGTLRSPSKSMSTDAFRPSASNTP